MACLIVQRSLNDHTQQVIVGRCAKCLADGHCKPETIPAALLTSEEDCSGEPHAAVQAAPVQL